MDGHELASFSTFVKQSSSYQISITPPIERIFLAANRSELSHGMTNRSDNQDGASFPLSAQWSSPLGERTEMPLRLIIPGREISAYE
jgi:hypothetical protein